MTATHIMIEQLRDYTRSLLCELVDNSIDFFHTDKGQELIAGFKKVYNKLALTTLTQNRMILAITGLQGAGKTTLMKRLYGLDDAYFPENQSRGEQIPILITEGDVQTPVGQVWKSVVQERTMNMTSEAVDSKNFCEIAMNPKDEHVWLELVVPYQYFQGAPVSFALMPGFEKDESQRSQQMLQHLLLLSTSSVVVIRKDTYARESSENMFQRVRDLFRGVKPIYAFSFGETNHEQNDSIRARAIQDLSIPEQEADRVIMTGDPEEFPADWMNGLVQAIGKYGFLTEEGERKQLRMLEALFVELRGHLERLQKVIKQKEVEAILQLGDKLPAHRIVREFEQMYEHTLQELDRAVLDELNRRTGTARNKFSEFVLKETGIIKDFIASFKPSALKEQMRVEQAIMEAWNQADAEKPERMLAAELDRYLEHQSIPLLALSDNGSRNPSSEVTEIRALSDEDFAFAETAAACNETEAPQESIMPAITSFERINRYFDLKNLDPFSLTRQDLSTMTVIGVLLCRQALAAKPLLEQSVIQGQVKNMDVSWFKPETDGTSMEQTMDTVKKAAGNLKLLEQLGPQVLKSIPLILGVDAVLDGELDTVTQASNALQAIGIALSPAQLIGVLGAGFVLAYGAHAVQKAVHDTNQRQLKLAQAGHLTIDKLPDLQTQAFIRSLRRVFEKMADHLREVHRQKSGDYDYEGQLDKMQYLIGRLRHLSGQLQRKVMNHGPLTL